MITLITGLPGAGKTAWAVNELHQLLARSGTDRAVLTLGIPDLKLPTQPCPPISEWAVLVPAVEDESLLEPRFTFADGSIVIIDEAQKVFPVRTTGSRVPPHVGALDRHRHSGLDFWLLTQASGNIDSHVRKLVGRHIHLRSSWSGRLLFEWPEAVDSSSTSARSTAATRRYKLPAKIFDLYTSSTKHVAQKHRPPLALYGLVVALLLGGFLAWRAYSSLSGKIESAQVASESAGGVIASDDGTTVQGGSVRGVALTPDLFTPRIATRPESAPLYDGIRQVRSLPVVAGCVAWDGEPGCTCYTQQGTDTFLPESACRELIRKPQFDPYREPYREAAKAGPGGEPQASTGPASPVEHYAVVVGPEPVASAPAAFRSVRAHRPSSPPAQVVSDPPASSGGFRR